MELRPLLLISVLVVSSCANDDGILRVEVPIQKKSASMTRSDTDRPEPVYSTSFAIRLAELALKESGVLGFEDRSVAVSYMEGVYTVTFERPETSVLAKDYTVAIEASTSRILEVKTGE